MTSMTIIDDLLVLLDDEESRDLESISQALPDRSKQTLSSTIGRLISKGWIERAAGRAKHQYRISRSGQSHVTQLLDQIKYRSEREWDGTWEEVVFNIPERDRKRRDELRLLLVELGFGRLHNSLWLSPWSHKAEIEQYIKETSSQNDISLIHTGVSDSATNKRIGQLFEWDWQSLDADYQIFIQEAKQFLKQKNKDSFLARQIVYHYAKVLLTDPKLPDTLPVRSKRAAEAYKLYEEIRPFCYAE